MTKTNLILSVQTWVIPLHNCWGEIWEGPLRDYQNNPKERLGYLVCMTEHTAVPNLTLRPPIPHVVTESQSNSGRKVSQEISGPISCSQQGHFEVRLSCSGLHKAGSWKVLGMENSGALSGFSLLRIFAAYGFRGVVIVKTLVIHKGNFEHMKRSLKMWALKSYLCLVPNSVPSALVLHMYIPNYAWIITKDFWGSSSPVKLDWGIQVLKSVLQIRWDLSIPTLKSIALAKNTFSLVVIVFQRLQGT